MRRVLVGTWQRLEWYSAFIFTGLRLGIWMLAAFFIVMIAWDIRSILWVLTIFPMAVVIVLGLAERSLIVLEQDALKASLADSQEIAESVANGIRRMRMPVRIIFGMAYFISAAMSILLTVWIEWAWNVNLHFSDAQALYFGLGLTFAMSFTSNLALNAWLAAWGAPPAVTRGFFKHRLLIDSVAAIVIGGIMIPLLRK